MMGSDPSPTGQLLAVSSLSTRHVRTWGKVLERQRAVQGGGKLPPGSIHAHSALPGTPVPPPTPAAATTLHNHTQDQILFR